MIRKGQTIENPVTGERMLFHATSADTNPLYEPANGLPALASL